MDSGQREDPREVLGRRLLTSLEELLKTESFIAISVARLVEHAGVSRSGFYLHFSDKADLLRTLATSVMGELFVSAQSWWGLPPGATKEDLRRALELIIENYLPHSHLMAAIVEATYYDATVAQQYALLMGEAKDRVAEYIRQAQETGDAREDIDVERVATWLTWMIERGLYQLVATAEPESRKDFETAAVEIIWRTLYGRAG